VLGYIGVRLGSSHPQGQISRHHRAGSSRLISKVSTLPGETTTVSEL
jgi:hypothetical protein